MATFPTKMLQAMVAVKSVVHYYNAHTAADESNEGRVSVENVQRVVEWMTRLRVQKYAVRFGGNVVRGNVETYADRIVIHVRADLTEEWRRATVIKELCHPLLDAPDELSADGVETIKGLVRYRGVPFDGGESDQVRSEFIAEFMALEILYPIEFRDDDRAGLQNGTKLENLVQKRGVPAAWILRAIDPAYNDICKALWKELEGFQPQPLTPL